MGDWTGTVPSHASGAKSKASKLQTLDDIATALTAAWTTWTPTLTNLTLGSGTLLARYRRLNKTLDFRFRFIFGSGSAVGTSPSFTLPYTPHSSYTAINDALGHGFLLDNGTATRFGSLRLVSGSTVEIVSYTTAGVLNTTTATFPQTWASGDSLSLSGTIELA